MGSEGGGRPGRWVTWSTGVWRRIEGRMKFMLGHGVKWFLVNVRSVSNADGIPGGRERDERARKMVRVVGREGCSTLKEVDTPHRHVTGSQKLIPSLYSPCTKRLSIQARRPTDS